jgi:hypothetical protein
MFAYATYDYHTHLCSFTALPTAAIFAPNHVKHFALFDFCGYQLLLQKTHGIYQDIPA